MSTRASSIRIDVKLQETGEMLALLQRISGTGPVDVMAARLMVEPYAATAAALNATGADLAAIREAHGLASAETDPMGFERLDAEFHTRIFAATRNELLLCLNDILRVVRNQSSWIEIKRRSYSEPRRRQYCDEHELIIQALFSRNGDGAAQAMKNHLLTVNRNLFGDGQAY
ncbi:FadR/GntR family transcriptional regulator [Taklimakanibacter lacteus]|uniref:FadR/GntR family transcriptional regulator n=1 Tax=Taklimakanibacter lacteus TaxID=2268456 RepID=UPI0013C4B501